MTHPTSSDRAEGVRPLNVGDRIKDNDPRIGRLRVLTVTEVLPNGVAAKDAATGRTFIILRRRIYTDGKPRRNGFDLVAS